MQDALEPAFACRVVRDDGGVRIEIAGEIDLAARSRLDGALGEALDGAPALTVDLTRVTFIDSTGLHWLVRAQEAAAEGGLALQILVGDGPVRLTLLLSGLDRKLPLAPTAANG